MQKPRLIIFRVAVMVHSVVRHQEPALGHWNQNATCDLPFLIFISTTLPASPLLAFNAQTGRFIVEQGTVSKGANLAICTCLNTHFQIWNQLGSGNKATRRQMLMQWICFLMTSLKQIFEGVLTIKRCGIWSSRLIQRWRIYFQRKL